MVDTKEIVKTKETKLDIQYPELFENITILKQVLLPLELWCLKYALYLQRPISTREFYIPRMVQILFSNYSSQEFGIKDSLKKINKKLALYIDWELNRNFWEKEISKQDKKPVKLINPYVFPEYKFYIRLADETLHIESGYSSETQLYRDIEKTMRKLKISFPSYKKIFSTLTTLESWNIFARRYEESKKSDFYWILNPKFTLKYQSKFNEILATL